MSPRHKMMERKFHLSPLDQNVDLISFSSLIFTGLFLKSIPKTVKPFLFPFAKDIKKKSEKEGDTDTQSQKETENPSGEVCVIGQVLNLWSLASRTRV